jgi:hypothetical protein
MIEKGKYTDNKGRLLYINTIWRKLTDNLKSEPTEVEIINITEESTHTYPYSKVLEWIKEGLINRNK